MSRLGENMLGIYEKSLPDSLSMEEKIFYFKKSGYDFFELSIDESEERMARLFWNARQTGDLKKLMCKMDFPVYSICLSANRKFPVGHEDGAIRQKGLELIRRAADLALAIGARIVLIPGYDVYYGKSNRETRKLFEESLAEAAFYAGKRGVVLALENIETPFMDSAEKTSAQVRKIGTPWLQCYVDPGNMIAAGIDNPTEQVRRAGGSIAAMHLKDGRPGEFKHVGYGTGALDFRELFGTLLRDRTACLFVAEINALEGVEESVERIHSARRFLEEQYEYAQKDEKEERTT